METVTFELNGEFIELCNLLKLVGIANSGGQGKLMVSYGIVEVDGKIETRRTAKIRAGQIVECMGQKIKVTTA
jgi:ribosome-associated protein